MQGNSEQRSSGLDEGGVQRSKVRVSHLQSSEKLVSLRGQA